MADIVTLGELLIDLTQTDVTAEGVRLLAAFPGGAPANVAVAAARLGVGSAFIGKVGRDSFGADLRRVLSDNGVDVTGLYDTAEAATTLAIVTVRDGERSFSFYRSPGADTRLTREEVLRALESLGRPAFLHLGSLSLTAEPARDAAFAALEFARERRICVSYDPNYRAALWPDLQTAVRWMKAPLPYVRMLKVSDEELPLLTLGGDGVFCRFGDFAGTVKGFLVQVADTNGAGDTFLGAMLSRLALRGTDPLAGLTGEELKACLTYANRAAALTCMRHGAIPAMPTKEEVENGF